MRSPPKWVSPVDFGGGVHTFNGHLVPLQSGHATYAWETQRGLVGVAVCLRPKKSTHKNGEKLQWSHNVYIIPFFEVLGGAWSVLDCLFVFACMNTRAIGQLSFSLVQEVHQPARMFFEPKK